MKITQFVLTIITSTSLFACASQPLSSLPKLSDGILVGTNGMTLYTYDKDVVGNGKSNCNGPCIAVWPAVSAAAITPSGRYSLVTRDDGSSQLAYDGKPLYLYVADKQVGDRKGDKFKNVWHVVKE